MSKARAAAGSLAFFVLAPGLIAGLIPWWLTSWQMQQPLPYAAAVSIAVATFVRGYEKPVLTRRFGARYIAYRKAVPAWWPRGHPWEPDQVDES